MLPHKLPSLTIGLIWLALYACSAYSATEPAVTYHALDFAVNATLPAPAGTCALNTTVILPTKGKPKAVVFFLHGSGPLDRNGTIPGGTMMYHDLALALVKEGIASIRFDKRTVYTDCASRIDASFEPRLFYDDSLAVYNNAMARPELSGTPLYVFGHSQGASFAIEMVAKGLFSPRGLILTGGLGRFPIDATVIRQLKQTVSMQTSAAAKKQAEAEVRQAEDFFSRLHKGYVRKTEAFMGAYSGFWRSYQDITEATKVNAAKIKCAVLVAQGSADREVTVEDFDALKTAFIGSKQVQSKLFDRMTHTLTDGDHTGVTRTYSSFVTNWISNDLHGQKP